MRRYAIPTTYLPYEPDQDFLLPPSIRELPKMLHAVQDNLGAAPAQAVDVQFENGLIM